MADFIHEQKDVQTSSSSQGSIPSGSREHLLRDSLFPEDSYSENSSHASSSLGTFRMLTTACPLARSRRGRVLG